MTNQSDSVWQERSDYIDVVLHMKHDYVGKSSSDNPVPQEIGVRQALKNAVRRRVARPKIYYNPFIQFLIRIKKKMGIKFL